MTTKQYDADYYARWYHAPERRSVRRQATARRARLALSMAEFYLGRPVRSVLDVGCGEGEWRAPLLAQRPKLRYLGLDSSEHAIARYGRERNLRPARFGDLESLRFPEPFDLIVCADVMHYVATPELRRGLSGFAELGHVGYFEVFCRGDAIDGDLEGFIARRPRWYRQAFAAAGFTPIGCNGYVVDGLAALLTGLERVA